MKRQAQGAGGKIESAKKKEKGKAEDRAYPAYPSGKDVCLQ
jgi:hypothetical protein